MMKGLKPIVFWEGFPVCGLLLKRVVEEFGEDIIITATRPKVPFEGLERTLNHEILWFDEPNDIWKRRDEFSDRNLIIHTGWTHKGWLHYDKYMKKKNKAKVVVVVDNSYRGDIRQTFGAIYFRLFLKKYFDAAFVPGVSGRKLMEFFGMPRDKIYSPNYGAFEEIYKSKIPIEARKNEFLFVGQLNKRKGLDVLIEGFNQYKREGGSWSLRILGDGELRSVCNGKDITCEGFMQPSQIADSMNNAKVFILPSRLDNWGTVVCEAAACGMQLIITKTVGASDDILEEGKNGIKLYKLEPKYIKEALLYFEKMDDKNLKKGSEVSIEKAQAFDSHAYYRAFMSFADELIKNENNLR